MFGSNNKHKRSKSSNSIAATLPNLTPVSSNQSNRDSHLLNSSTFAAMSRSQESLNNPGNKNKNFFQSKSKARSKPSSLISSKYALPMQNIDSIPILEDDESDQVTNTPLLPSFEPPVPKPRPLKTPIKSRDNSKDNYGKYLGISPFDDDNKSIASSLASDADGEVFKTKSNKQLKNEIDEDFDKDFDKDIREKNGTDFLGLRRKRGLPTDKRNLPTTDLGNSSSDTDESTDEGTGSEGDVHSLNVDHAYNLEKHATVSNNSNASINSKESGLGRLFRKRTFSLSSKKEDKDQHKEEDEETNEDAKSSIYSSTSSLSKKDNFFRKIFHIDGMLGQGGMAPNSMVNDPPRKKEDEESLPMNSLQEVSNEAKVLVNQMMRGAQRRTSNASNGRDHDNHHYHNRNNSTVDDSNATNTEMTSDGYSSSTSGKGMFVPSNAHLQSNPFDDLQDIDQFSIDVPNAILKKPRKFRKGIASALMTLYNPHMNASTNSNFTSFQNSTVNSDNEGNQTDGTSTPGSSMPYNLEKVISPKELENKLRNAEEFQELKTIDSKVESLAYEYMPHEPKKKKQKYIPTKAASIHNFIRGGTSNRNSSDGTRNGSENNGFELPNFERKPSKIEFSSDVEKREMEGYKELIKRKKFKRKFKSETAARITVHIADVLQRQRFILTLCKAFMLYGAPTHRLEEYMSMTACVLEIDGSFIYFPGCMLISFGDITTRTSEMKLVRCPQGLDLGKLDEVHDIYKNVVHDRVGVEEASAALEELLSRKAKFSPWMCVFFYAFASGSVATWSFGGSWMDIPISFGIGAIIGFLQYIVCPRNTLYSSVFEVSSSIIASFIARAIGSINNGNTFCYAAIVQSSLALILPGYIILCGSLELQSRNLVAGGVRMFYAFIYSLMLSFGITLGAALYGWIDSDATSKTTCTSNVSPWFRFLFVPLFTIGIALCNQASWSQLPMMTFISGAGYVVTYFSSLHFKSVTELNAALGCFIIGLVSNLYSRLMKSFNKYFNERGSFMTVSLMLPAIFVQVPSGIASQGSVFVGISSANDLVHSNSTTTASTSSDSTSNTNSLSFGMVMIQVALGISVGLYMSTLLVYPLGKKKTGLFTL